MDDLRLITIPISHFCEKARWALELADTPYREERHLQGIHWAHVWRAGRGWTAPVLVTPKGPLRRVGADRALRRRPRAPRALPQPARGGARGALRRAARPGRAELDVPPHARAARPDGGVRRARRPALGARRAADDAAADVEADRAPRRRRRRARRRSRATTCAPRSTRSPRASATAAPTCAATRSAPPTSRSPRSPPPCSCPSATASRCRRSDELPDAYRNEVLGHARAPGGRFALRLYDQERP